MTAKAFRAQVAAELETAVNELTVVLLQADALRDAGRQQVERADDLHASADRAAAALRGALALIMRGAR